MATQASLDLLVDVSRSERQAQLSHFDSLDTKAGPVLGFSGVLIALSENTTSWAGAASTAFAGLAAAVSVGSFWPQEFPSLDSVRLGDYAASELAFTQITLLDTMELMILTTQSVLSVQARRLKIALLSLLIGAAFTAISVIDG